MLGNWIKEGVSTVGAGATLTLTGAVTADMMPFSARAVPGVVVPYAIKDGTNREVGSALYVNATTLTKQRIIEKWEAGVLTIAPVVTAGLTLSGSAQISSDAPAQLYGGTASGIGSNNYGGNVAKRVASAAPLQGATSTMNLLADNLFIAPFYLSAGMVLAAMCAYVTTFVAGSNSKLVLYSRLADGSAGALVASTGAISTAAVGLARGVITQSNVNLTPGWYWVGLLPSAAISVQTTDGNIISPMGCGAGDPRLQVVRLYGAALYSSGVPDPCPALSNISMSNNSGILQIVLEAA